MLEVSKDNFEVEVLQAAGPVLVDFWGEKCEPCRVLMPDVHRLAEQYGDKLKMYKLNTTENRRLAISQRVLGLPTFIVYKNGERIKEITGGENCTPEAVEALIKEFAE
jgi:thioredoxin 1